MYVLPSTTDGRSFELLIALDEIGLGRIIEYDPAVVMLSDLPHKWQMMTLHHYHLALAADLLRVGHAKGQTQPACLFAFSINPPDATTSAPATVFSVLDDANLAHLRSGKQIYVPFRDVVPPEPHNPRDLVIAYGTPGDMEVVDYSLDQHDPATAARQVTRGFARRRDLGDPMS